MRTTLVRFAAGVPHVLVAEAPGGTASRLAVERFLRRRGWVTAVSPADADILIVIGSTGPQLKPFVDRLWDQLPHPRVRVHVPRGVDVEAALADADRLLAKGGVSPGAEEPPPERGDHASHDDQHREHEEEPERSGDGAGHEHHGDGMEMPGGLPMAERGPDRDGLMLDQLHVPLGPLLVDWPAGLLLNTTLQGDVLQNCRVELVREKGRLEDFWNDPWRRAEAGEVVTAGECARRRAGAHLDSLARLLAVAGWADAALRARRLRDEVLTGASVEQVRPRWRRLARRLRGSRTLRWLTDGLGVLTQKAAEDAGIRGPALAASGTEGDVSARWRVWLAEVERSLPEVDDSRPLRGRSEGPRGLGEAPGGSAGMLKVLPELLEGAELAGARLIVASLDPDIAELDRAVVEPAHG